MRPVGETQKEQQKTRNKTRVDRWQDECKLAKVQRIAVCGNLFSRLSQLLVRAPLCGRERISRCAHARAHEKTAVLSFGGLTM